MAVDYTTNRIQTSAAYDANGNMTGYSGSSYLYDIENRMKQANPSSGGTVLYGYDSTNHRVYKGAYNGSSYSAEEIYFYGAEGHKYGTWQINPASGVLLKASVTKQWFGDRLLSPQDDLDSRGKYFPFGQERTNITPSNPANDQEKFASYTRDSATGLDYADKRYYNSFIGRFMRPDPFGGSANVNVPQTWNRYAYVGNDPANNFDPEGLFLPDCAWDGCSSFNGGGGGGGVPMLNALDAPNGTTNSGTYDGTALISDTSTCPPNCGSTSTSSGNIFTAFASEAANSISSTVNSIGSSFTNGFASLVTADTEGQAAQGAFQMGTAYAAAAPLIAAPSGLAGGPGPMFEEGPTAAAQTANALQIQQGMTVWRTFGGNSGPWGASWTSVDPATISNVRAGLGLPNGNTGQFLIQGTLNDASNVSSRLALSLDGESWWTI